MAQCKKCGKKGIFLKVNDQQLCESCAREAKEAEHKVRQLAHEEAKYILRTTESIQDTVSLIVDMGEQGVYSDETVSEAIALLNKAVAATKQAVAAVKGSDIDNLNSTIASSTKTVDEVHAKTLALITQQKN